jgi:hypothetical protein
VMGLLREWIMGLAGAAVVTGLALSLTPKGRVRSVMRLVCGAVMIIALIKPVIEFDFDAYSIGLARYRADMEHITASARETSDRLQRTIIEEECSAYILDKAHILGLDCTKAEVTVKWGDEGYWYPYEAHLQINGPQEQLNRLAGLIEAELGIPRERQHWSSDENQGS